MLWAETRIIEYQKVLLFREQGLFSLLSFPDFQRKTNMTPSDIFQWANASVLPAWILLLFVPKWKWTERLVRSGLWSAVLAILYTVLIIIYFKPDSEGSFDSLQGIMTMFSSEGAVLAGWVHYLAFDLFVGAWICSDAIKLGISKWLLIPFLLLSFMLGPMGFALYFLLRIMRKGNAFKPIF
jgi:hypothetical protein